MNGSDMQIDRAMILAAGLGTRMRPITNHLPKPLVQVADRSLLDWSLDNLQQGGISTVHVNVHHLADQIEDHLHHRTAPACVISDEREELLDSGGGVKKAMAEEEDGPFIILNGDCFWIDGQASNIARLKQAWDPDRMDMLLLVADDDQSCGYHGQGDFFLNDEDQLQRRGSADSAPYIYAGAIITTVSYITQITETRFSLNKLFDMAIENGRLCGLKLDGLWLHVGTPDSIGEAERAIERYSANTRSAPNVADR